jgi:hypothetical protein
MTGRFESLRASSLFCRRCGQAMPVRERLLLVLPDKEIYDYRCTGCGDSVGQREVTAGELRRVRSAAPPPPARRRLHV